MTALIVIAAIIGVTVFLLNIPVYAHIRYYGGKADVKVKYLMFTFFPRPEGKDRADNEQSEKDETDSSPPSEITDTLSSISDDACEDISSASEEDDLKDIPAKDIPKEKKKPEKKPLSERLSALIDDLTEKKDAFLTLWELIEGHLIKFGRKIKIDGLILDFAAAGEDAAETAVLYGKMNTAVYSILAWLKCYLKVNVRSVDIDCLYNTSSEKTRYDGEMKIKLRPASLLNAITAVLFGYLGGYKKYSPALQVFTKK